VTFRLADVEPSPDVFAAVMATGILSIAAGNHHYRQISEAMGVLASLGLVVLVALVIVTHRFTHWDLRDPDVTLRLFTFVAACAVLDGRLASQRVLQQALGVVALVSWLALIVLSARNMSACAWSELRDRAHGAWELASVGTSGLAIVAAKVARYTPEHWWLAVSVPVWLAALCIYGLMTWLILWRSVAQRQDRDGFEPDTWILMGGLAIATLAGDNIHRLAPTWLAGPVLVVTVMTWVAATLWISAADLLRPAPDQPSPRNAALRRCVVGVRLPAGHVLRGQLHHGSRDRTAFVGHRVAGRFLGRAGGVADCRRRRVTAVVPQPG
jgi:hypothetical protein